ncbi:MAG TPA: 50S ribosomal protein L15 [Lentisphaeria bacterium]|nr:MAG: 50S ribosomal protein L15 [Lentisphaerae bacterium GWF2_49_21]HBC85523.1 50S ribosomal protein L15 [Lentisphaeria bacterium]
MKLHDLHTSPSKKRRKVRGRGDGSGLGGTSGKGHKGQKARSGCTIRPFFEGGQIPFFRRLPKRGFNNPTRKAFNLINVDQLEKAFAAGDVVDDALLHKKGLIAKTTQGLKILGNGEIKKSITVKANKFSASAKSKIEAAGGKCELI